MKKIISIIIICSLLCGCENTSNIEKISCNKLEELQQEDNTVIIDVRTKEEYNENHLDNAINIPVDIIATEIEKQEDINNNTNIIVYCKSGVRSDKAAHILEEQKYKKIYDLGAISNCS